MNNHEEFIVSEIKTDNNLYDELSKIKLEPITVGRSATVLVKVNNKKIPIIRTTTAYQEPTQNFDLIPAELTNQLNFETNNAMIELYQPTYKTMKFHSDQSLDLEDDSTIALYSCYKIPDGTTRVLEIRNKTTHEIKQIRLKHNSVVEFSTNTNSKYLY